MSTFNTLFYIGLSMYVVAAAFAILCLFRPSSTNKSAGADEDIKMPDFIPLDGPEWRRNVYLNTYNRQAWRMACVVLDVTEIENNSTHFRAMLLLRTDQMIQHLINLQPKRI